MASAAEIAVTNDYVYVFDSNIRQINIFNKKNGQIVDLISADKLFGGQRGVNLLAYEGNNVLALVKASKQGDPDKFFMLNL